MNVSKFNEQFRVVQKIRRKLISAQGECLRTKLTLVDTQRLVLYKNGWECILEKSLRLDVSLCNLLVQSHRNDFIPAS